MDLDAKNQKNSRFGFQEHKDLVIPSSKRKSSPSQRNQIPTCAQEIELFEISFKFHFIQLKRKFLIFVQGKYQLRLKLGILGVCG